MPDLVGHAVAASGYRLRIESRWSGAGTVTCQWVDPESGRFLREAEWQQANPQAVHEVELPPAPGRYRFYVTARQGERWGYEQGAPMLVVDAEVQEQGVVVQRSIIATLAALRRERWPALLREVLAGPWQAYWNNRHLIASMVRRDISSRYRGSFADAFWALLNPLLLMLTYYFVFGVFLRTRFPGDPTTGGYVLFFLAGMLPWLAMNESLARGPNTALEHRNLITKMIFPVEVLPFNLTLAGWVTGLTATAIYFGFLLWLRGAIPLTALWLPVLWAPQLLLTAGLCYVLAATGVYVRDLVYVMGLLLTMWFFLTPICYPDQNLPQALLPVLGKNPLYVLVRAYRAILIENRMPDWGAVSKLWGLALVIFYAGFALFRRARRGFADVL